MQAVTEMADLTKFCQTGDFYASELHHGLSGPDGFDEF